MTPDPAIWVRIPQGATWVRFPRFVGDTVMQMPVLRALRQVAGTPLVVWGPASTVALVEGTDLADAVLPERDKPGPWAMANVLRRYQAARSVHFPKSLRPALAAFLARVPERLGVSESFAGAFNTHTAPFWKAKGTFLERYHAVLAQRWPGLLPLPFADYVPPLSVERPSQPYICLMPGASNSAKAWEPLHYRDLARLAFSEGLEVVVLGAPSEKGLGELVLEGQGLNLCGATTLPQAGAWLAGALGALGNDSGLSHLAAACGIPTLALFGATDPRASAPFGPQVQVLRREDLLCSPCMLKVCPIPGHPCQAGLSPERVWAKLLSMLEPPSPHPAAPWNRSTRMTPIKANERE